MSNNYTPSTLLDFPRSGRIQDDDYSQSNITQKLLPPRERNALKYRILGLVCLVIIVGSWIAMAEDLQALQRGSQIAPKYNQPYFQTYVVHSGYTLTIPLWAAWYFCFTVRKHPEKFRQQITLKVLLTTMLFSLFTYVSAYSWYRSLPITDVASNTAIYQSSCVFIFLFSVPLLHEKASIGKIISVLSCVAGVVVISFFGKSQEDGVVTTVGGYIWVLVSTIVYSFTETLYGKIVHSKDGSEQEADASFSFLFLGLTGVFTFLLYWPGMLILHFTNIEPFLLPSGPALYSLLINIFLDAIFNGFFYLGIFLTSPLFMSIGSLFTIPISVVVDFFLHNLLPSPPSILGMAAIIIGFLGLNLSEILADRVQRNYGDPETQSNFDKFIEFLVQDLRQFCVDRPSKYFSKRHSRVAYN